MESTDLLPIVGASLLTALPSVAVYVVVIVVAVSKWNQHPRASMFAAAGAGLLMLLDLLSRAFFTVMPLKLMREESMPASAMGTWMTVAGVVSGLLHAIALGVLAAAIFVDRGPPSAAARS